MNRVWKRTNFVMPLLLATASTAVAQTTAPATGMPPSHHSASWITIRLQVAPNHNRMTAWREGLNDLKQLARQQFLNPSGSDLSGDGASFGGTVSTALTPHLELGAELSWIWDTNWFDVEQKTFGLAGEALAEYRTSVAARSRVLQLVAAVRPVPDRRALFVQVGGGWGTGRVEFDSPGGTALGRGGGFVGSGVVGVELWVLQVAAGVRHHRLGVDYLTVMDTAPTDEKVDWFSSVSDLQAFVDGREAEFTAAFLRIGIALHLFKR